MNYNLLAVFLTSMVASNTLADLKPDVLDCDPKKAARNAAMDATVGVSGRCDAGKAAKNTKEDVVDDVKDSVDMDLDRIKRHPDDDKGKRKLKRNGD